MRRVGYLACLLCVLLSCRSPAAPRQVVVYTSVDQTHAEPILDAFEAQSGIRVLAVYDVEATKTVGLAQRLIAERARPQADVFWNGEFLQTIQLKGEGVLARADFSGAGLPDGYLDPEGYWAAFGGRGRVILVNTDRVSPGAMPASRFDLLSDAYAPAQVGLANPLFGTTATEAAALYAELGAGAAHDFYAQVAQRGVQVLDGNSVVRDQVAAGQLAWGLTDTDDACGALLKGAPVQVVFPDQGPGEMGTLIVPNTVALIAGGPNREAAGAFIDYLLSPETEALLVTQDWIHFPSRPVPVDVVPACFAGVQVQGMRVGFEAIYEALPGARDDLQAIFVR